ncbi:MAG TPA: MFS transporter, partial [Burkholderiaceae bacterium]|nr:MFS transporter [Burkholderiaceae bacterium]
MPLRPDPVVTAEQLEAGKHSLVLDAGWASVTGAFSSGVILVAFALALGANPVQIGLLAAIPFMAQAAQLPATLLIERIRQRRKIGVLVITTARVIILSLAFLPFVPNLGIALALLIAAQIAMAILHAVGACAVNSWLHQLVPGAQLGNFFSQRLFWSTALACVGTLAAGFIVDQFPWTSGLHTYSIVFVIAGLTGFVSSFYLARAPEPLMQNGGPAVGMRTRVLAPFRDRNFRRLLVFMGAWNVASNLAAPFIAVYLMQQLGYALTTVTALWVISQIANALTMYAWGRVSDRLSNKAILAAALPVYFLCTLGLVFVDAGQPRPMQLSLLAVIHIVMGIAGGGIGLATGNLGLKLAPQGQGTAYLAAIGLVSAVAGGLAPIVAGSLAHFFQASELSAVVRWVSSTREGEITVVRFAHWEFLFALSAALGLYVMHALSRVSEGSEI